MVTRFTWALDVPQTETFDPHALPSTDWTFLSNGNGRIQIAADEGASKTNDFVASDFLASGINRGRGNIFRATSNHFITAHAFHLARANASTVTLFVLESTSTNGVFTNKYESSFAVGVGTGYVERSALSIPLYSGRYYAVGATWTSNVTYQYDSGIETSYAYGAWISGFSLSVSNPPATTTVSTINNLYRQRIQTSVEGCLRMDDSIVNAVYSTNRATVVMDYRGYRKAWVSFRHRSRGDEAQTQDGLFISTNNSTYVRIHALSTSASWISYTVDVFAAAASNSMVLSSNTYIRFQQMDELGVPDDGREFDDLRMYSDADIALNGFPLTATSRLFRGFSTNKTLTFLGSFTQAGGHLAFTNISPVRYRLLQSAVSIHQTNIVITNRFVPFTSATAYATHTIVIPEATLLTNIQYTLEGLADATNSLAEGSESNNTATLALRVNHYSGNLYFSNVLTSITITNWSDQAGFTNSLTNHVISGGGTVSGYPFSFTNLKVRKSLATLDYTVDPTEVQTVYVAATNRETAGTIDFVRPSGVVLSRSGGLADFKVTLPAGSGYSLTADDARLSAIVSFPSVWVRTDLLPVSAPNTGGVRYFVEETKPLRITVTDVKWQHDSGLFELSHGDVSYVRASHLTTLEGLTLAPGLKRIRPSNELMYRYGVSSGGAAILDAGPDGEALLTINLGINTGEMTTHFPYNTFLQWNAGFMAIDGDTIRAPISYLTNVSTFAVSYAPGCNNGCLGSSVFSNVYVRPVRNMFVITEDGGLHAQGVLTQVHNLAWGLRPDGLYAQRVTNWSTGNFHMPGHFLLGSERAAILNAQQGPGILLFTGVKTNGASASERFGNSAYADGFADYAGMNFRLAGDGDKRARSTLGMADSGAYPLKGISKYYTRYSGVSGIHQAMPFAFPTNLTIYGYEFQFSNYGLNYLSNSNRDSRTEGIVDVRYPADFMQDFEEMRFTCPGDLADAKIPDGSSSTNMVYWNAPLDIYTMAFERNSGCTNIGSGYLTLGISTFAQHVEPPMFGKLGYFNSGNIIPAAFGLTNVDSRLSLPAVIEIDGPKDEIYRFAPVTKAYFNNYTNAGSMHLPSEGFVSFAGTMDVPFFMDLMVQFHVPAGTGAVGSIYMMGGWPDAGWKSGGADFFNYYGFDGLNRAWPADAGDVADYRAQSDDEYIVRARQSWLNLIDLSYPVRWSYAAKSFTSSEQVDDDIFVLNVAHQVDYLSAERAELSFGLQYGNLPSINLANMAANGLTEATGMGQAFINAAGEELVGTLDAGLSSLDALVDNQARDLMDPVLDSMFDPIIHTLYTNLQSAYAPNANYYTAAISNYIRRTTSGSLNHAVRYLADGFGYPTSVVGKVDAELARVEGMMNAIIGTVEIDPVSGLNLATPRPGILNMPDFPIIGDLAEEALGMLAEEIVNALGPELLTALQDAFVQVQPSLEAIAEIAAEIKASVEDMRVALDAANDFASELESIVTPADANNLTSLIASDLEAMFGSFPSAHNPFADYSEAEMKAMIRNKIEVRLFGSPIMANLTRVVRSWVYDLNSRVREATDSMFQQVNTMMREVVSGYLGEMDNSINGMLGDLSDTMGTGQINGYAHITGDTLSELRLDGKFQWDVPKEMEFKGYLLIKELESSGSGGCEFDGGVANTVEIGANEVDVDWFGSDVAINVAVKFTLDEEHPVGMGGSVELAEGEIDFEAFAIDGFAAAVMFGLHENYLAGRISGYFDSYSVAGGAFFGRTCTLDPIILVDRDVADVLGTPPFSGIYVYGQAWMPIVDYGCFFTISAGVGAGFFYFVEGPTIGAKMLLGVSGEALCVVGVSGEVTLVGVKSGNTLTAKGKGTISGRVGACPLCVEFEESASVIYKNGSWDVDY